MKKTTFLKMAMAVMAISATTISCTTASNAGSTSSPDLSGILGGAGSALSGVLEGVFTKSDLTVQDIAGEWTATGSAVSFQSDNFLKKAGGAAAAGVVEEKLNDYYKKFGLTGAKLDIDSDGNFSLTIGKIPLKGTVEVKEKGIFNFNFNAGGLMKLGSMKAYVEKTPTGLNVMFDADKIKNIMTLAASISGSKMVSTADQLLKQYDGICIGFKMTGQSAATDGNNVNDAVNTLKGLFGM